MKRAPQRIADGRIQLRGECPICSRFLKFLPQGDAAFYVGRYKGKTIKEVAATDRQYLVWALENMDLSNRTKAAIREVL